MPTQTVARISRPKPRTMPSNANPVMREPTHDQIRARAYEIFMARGATPGNPDSDWHQAEQELRGRMTLLGKT